MIIIIIGTKWLFPNCILIVGEMGIPVTEGRNNFVKFKVCVGVGGRT